MLTLVTGLYFTFKATPDKIHGEVDWTTTGEFGDMGEKMFTH